MSSFAAAYDALSDGSGRGAARTRDLAALGLRGDESPAEVRKAYRRLAAQHHPDRGGDRAKYEEVRARVGPCACARECVRARTRA